MQVMRRIAVLLLGLVLATPGAQASEPVTNFNVVLLQPSDVLEARVPSVDALADYIKAVQGALREAVAGTEAQEKTRQSVGGFVVLAVRPGLQSKVWLDFDQLLDLQVRKQIALKVGAVKPFEAREGPVVFALKVALWDGKESRRVAPLPAEWKRNAPAASASAAAPEVGALVESIWND
ncbi:hypothetical protein [Paucibacter soli]|uniref:hypothetical protein n=1 Tax=Paucibacter soli TaxID=3133433 RepID=UPI0030AF4F86